MIMNLTDFTFRLTNIRFQVKTVAANMDGERRSLDQVFVRDRPSDLPELSKLPRCTRYLLRQLKSVCFITNRNPQRILNVRCLKL